MTITEVRKRQKIDLIFNTIREHPDFTKTEVKKHSGLSMESVMQYVESLMRDEYIYQSGTKGSKVGRKGECLRVNPTGAYFIGIKFTAKSINAMLLDLAGTIVAAKDLNISKNILTSQKLLEYIFEVIDGLMLILGERVNKIKSIGIGAPGFIDFEKGILKRYYNIENDDNIPVKKILEDKYGIPTYIEHTVKTKAISYRLTPANRNANDFIYILIGSGVAMASMIDGKLYRSIKNDDGEIGHIVVDEQGEVCKCGKRGCLETVAGTEAIMSQIRSGVEVGRFSYFVNKNLQNIEIDDFLEAVVANDNDSLQLLDNAARYLALVASSAVTILSPLKLIVCGEYVLLDAFKEKFREHLNYFCLKELSSELSVEYLKNCKSMNAYDAALLGFYRQFYNAKLI